MKTFYLISIASILLWSCNIREKSNEQHVSFGIHEVVKRSDIPISLIDSLKSKGVQIEANQVAIIGYITETDSMALKIDIPVTNIKLVKTSYPVDREKKYYAIVAIRPVSGVDISHIKKTIAKGNDIVIYFNYEGAKKWADFTQRSIGQQIVFIIENQIYTITSIHDEIRNGVAKIVGLNNETVAKKISESLNSNIPE